MNLEKIDLRKNHVLNLKKESGLGIDSKAQVVLALDYSYSMNPLYSNGTVQDTVERILPFGLAFDDNGEVDFYLFEDNSIKLPENITLKNLDGYIANKVYGKYKMGGTNYAPVLNFIYRNLSEAKKGFFGGAKKVQMDTPVYVIFITDGNNYDKSETEEIIQKMSKEGFFVQFIGIGKEQFQFLDKLDNLPGRLIDNVNFFKINDIRNCPDNELYAGLMKEYPTWVKEAKTNNLIK
jgi:hypothetical protein